MNKQQLINQLREEGFSEHILKAFEKVEREEFVPEHLKKYAYRNEPLPIALGSTISQPYTIAFMLNLLELNKLADKNRQDSSSNQEMSSFSKTKKFEIINKKNKIKILEIGSGSGYVLALINEIFKILKTKNYEIYGIEIIEELVESSKKVLKKEIKNKKIHIMKRDGSKGLIEKSPFDRILVSAAFDKIPEQLFSQLNENGIMVCPVRNSIFQFKKIDGKIQSKEFPGFVFVPVVEE